MDREAAGAKDDNDDIQVHTVDVSVAAHRLGGAAGR
jgi:hypothetical protein